MSFSTTRLLLACLSTLATVVRASDGDSCDDGKGIRMADASKVFSFENSTAVRHFDDPEWLLFNSADRKFNISWRCADPAVPVLLQWTINNADNKPELRWGQNLTITDTKTGNGTYWWNPFDTLMNGTFAPDVSSDRVRVQASMHWNTISVSQPEKNKEATSETQPFILQFDSILKFMQSQYKSGEQAEYQRWLMAVIPAVLIGVIIFSLTGIYIGYSLEKRQIYKRQTAMARASQI